jgi:dienelactone hydrolase
MAMWKTGIASVSLALTLLPAGAVEYIEPSPEQAARCAALPDARLQNMCRGGYTVRGLKFPEGAERFGVFGNAGRMAIFRPDGPGPHPAVLLLHTCAAVDFDPQHMRFWVRRALAEGYVAFVVDSWSQRGITELCRSRPPGFLPIHMMVRSRDAYEALAHLARFDFVDARRVATIGFSNGGRVSYLVASGAIAQAYAVEGRRFAATVAVYGQCFNREFSVNFLRTDVDRPLLALLGSLDEDGNPEDCIPRFEELKGRGVEVSWHVFPGTGHAWDQPIFRQAQRFTQTGNSAGVLFAYDARVAEESLDRVFTYLGGRLKAR